MMHKPWGYSRSFKKAPFFYVMVGVGTLGGTLFTLIGVDPVKLLVFSALINGLLAPPFLVLIMLVANDGAVMGEHRNGRAARLLGWTATALMTAAAVLYLALNYL